MTEPVVFCYDGSQGSQHAMVAAAALIEQPAAAIVLTVWQTVGEQLARAGAFSGYDADEDSDDTREEASARQTAEQGAAAAQQKGFDAQSRVELADGEVAKRIMDVCDDVGARLIVCGRRGRGAISSALLGSVSRELIERSGRPVLVTPEAQGGS